MLDDTGGDANLYHFTGAASQLRDSSSSKRSSDSSESSNESSRGSGQRPQSLSPQHESFEAHNPAVTAAHLTATRPAGDGLHQNLSRSLSFLQRGARSVKFRCSPRPPPLSQGPPSIRMGNAVAPPPAHHGVPLFPAVRNLPPTWSLGFVDSAPRRDPISSAPGPNDPSPEPAALPQPSPDHTSPLPPFPAHAVPQAASPDVTNPHGNGNQLLLPYAVRNQPLLPPFFPLRSPLPAQLAGFEGNGVGREAYEPLDPEASEEEMPVGGNNHAQQAVGQAEQQDEQREEQNAQQDDKENFPPAPISINTPSGTTTTPLAPPKSSATPSVPALRIPRNALASLGFQGLLRPPPTPAPTSPPPGTRTSFRLRNLRLRVDTPTDAPSQRTRSKTLVRGGAAGRRFGYDELERVEREGRALRRRERERRKAGRR